MLCVFDFYPFFMCVRVFFSRGDRTQAFKYKLTKLILWGGCPSYHLISKKKSALIHKLVEQIPKAFNQHSTAGKAIKYLVFQSCFRIL